MPRKSGKAPSYCLHKASGRAIVYIDRRAVYLGPYGSPESHQAYERQIAEWRIKAQQSAADRDTGLSPVAGLLTISAALYRFREFARGYYAKNGRTTKEFVNFRYSLPVQETEFSSGRGVVVNFGKTSFTLTDKHTVKAHEYRAFLVTSGGRTYLPPPPPNVFAD